jgi:hypothetical protein
MLVLEFILLLCVSEGCKWSFPPQLEKCTNGSIMYKVSFRILVQNPNTHLMLAISTPPPHTHARTRAREHTHTSYALNN